MTSQKSPVFNAIVSGIQPTGRMHIGNYVGAVQNWLKLQEKDSPFYIFIADYHAMSGTYEPEDLRQRTFDLALDLLACGIDPKKVTFFVQSHVPEHTELGWIFNNVTPVSFLERMTQFKDKSGDQSANVNMGLFDYPVLQAADILLYKGAFVPVGQDQVQHVELTRDIARFFNNKYAPGEGQGYFPETKPLLTAVPKLRSITEPTRKMSKSLGEKAYIALIDSPEEIAEKMKRAVTETTGMLTMTEEQVNGHLSDHGALHNEDEQLKGMAGVWNLLTMLRIFGSAAEADAILAAQPIRYGDLKKLVAQRIAEFFAEFRERRAVLARDPEKVHAALAAGAKKASLVAAATMEDVRKLVGVR